MGTASHARLLHRWHRHGSFEGRSSRVYDVMARRLLRGVHRRIAEDIAVAAPAGGAVLDVGTGPGVLLIEIARLRPDLQVTGVDVSADMVAAAVRNLGDLADHASAQVADVADLPFGDDSFDVIVTSFSAHHWDDVRRAVPELARVLRPGGSLFIYDFRHGPFDELDAAARESAAFAGRPPQHAVIRAGSVHLWRFARHILFAG